MSELTAHSRRRFLRWAAGGLLAGGVSAAAAGREDDAGSGPPDPVLWAPRSNARPIASPQEALDVFDLEPVAHAKVPPAHFGYMASGIDDEVTLRANREGFGKFQIWPRRLRDVSSVDLRMTLFGESYATPIILGPVGGLRAYHPDAEPGTARAAKAGDHLMILSTMSSVAVEDVQRARGRPLWFQLYPTNDPEVARRLVQRAERAGCTAVAVTVDRSGGRNQETFFRMRRLDPRACAACHTTAAGPAMVNGREQPMFADIDLSRLQSVQASALTWERLKRIRDATKMRCVVKGLLSPEDARLAAEAGYDAIVVSNHGGRADESGLSAIEALPAIVQAVGGRMPVLVDSGFRRGTDIVKALAMGAAGVAIGRPYLWGLGAFGQAGVERALELLRIELRAAMQQAGAKDLKALSPALVRHV